MKKIMLVGICLVLLAGCQAKEKALKEDRSQEKTTQTTLQSGRETVETAAVVPVSSENSLETTTTTANPFPGYTAAEIKAARVICAYATQIKMSFPLYAAYAEEHPAGEALLPFAGSVTLDTESGTVTVQSDETVAGSSTITYTDNGENYVHYVTIPNHYQDERYNTDSEWVRTTTQEMVDYMANLKLSTDDELVAQVLPMIQFQ